VFPHSCAFWKRNPLVLEFVSFLFFFILRQGLSMLPRLSWNSQSPTSGLPNAEDYRHGHHTQTQYNFLNSGGFWYCTLPASPPKHTHTLHLQGLSSLFPVVLFLLSEGVLSGANKLELNDTEIQSPGSMAAMSITGCFMSPLPGGGNGEVVSHFRTLHQG
jgi:hypothetical protein